MFDKTKINKKSQDAFNRELYQIFKGEMISSQKTPL